MVINEDLFLQRYNGLNVQQKDAVDTIYGPVMVIAGPGTGKTEVLALRIANLLRSEAQVQPSEILCLTYTEEATNAMRRRLVQVIGPAAHKVNIATFHAFCNNVIQSNAELFSQRALQPISDLERTDLLYDILEKLPPGHVLRKLSGNIYYDAGKLNRLFEFMKRENMRHPSIVAAIAEYLDDLPNREGYVYKRKGPGYVKGDLKQKEIDEEARRMESTAAAAELFDTYVARMKEEGRYDFNDMIIWVLDAFENNSTLLQSYQERHQFILVDEFQDTNGAQNQLLNYLTLFWEDPNIFVVGDDDQSIYEFQGARIRNIIDFYERYKDGIKIIILAQNYRSSQPILDKATTTIVNNKQRLIYQLEHLKLDKNITAAAARFLDAAEIKKPTIKVYNNVLQEETDVLLQIEQLQQAGVPLNNVAVLYAQHKQADNIIALLERKGIPYNVKKPVNILDMPLIQQVLNVLSYIERERKEPFSGEALLFEILHAPYYEISPTDIATLSLYIQQNRAKDKSLGYWRFILSKGLLLEQLELPSTKALIRMGHNMDEWARAQTIMPLPLLVEKIVYESGIVAYLLQRPDHIWNIQVLHTFFDYVRELHGRNPRIRVVEFLGQVERMNDEGISIPVQKVVQNDNGVHFFTAHGAKGNEFEHVFLIGTTKNFWEAKRGSNFEYKLPDTITKTDDDHEKTYKIEVARRLFYVALTRAKKHLHVSFALNDNNGKSMEASVFIEEISTAGERTMHSVDAGDIVSHLQLAMEPVPEVRIKLANGQWIERQLQQLIMSYTTLSKYLYCPLGFYYENLLRVPFQKNDALAFGSAVHNALERFFKEMKAASAFPGKERLLAVFDSSMFAESASFTAIMYERRMEQGHTILSEYYDRYINEFPTNVEIEWKVGRYLLDGVPVTGKIDKMEIDGDSCTIVDYKTGDPDRWGNANTAAPNEKEPLGGDYWRQMVFYKLLIENHDEKRLKVTMGMFDYIQKNGKTGEFKRYYVPMFAQDEETVRQQLKDTYSRIMNHEFDTGCGRKDCYWCNFARKYELVRPAHDEMVEIDDWEV
jgi:DNA helicase-2/ATP-dependent DNA helicase PcrA